MPTTPTQEQVFKQFKEVHGNKYDYSVFKYVSANFYSKIICPKHGDFDATPKNHLNGSRCPHCVELINTER